MMKEGPRVQRLSARVRNRRHWMLAVLVIVSAVCASAPALAQDAALMYVIGAEDVLDIRVWGHDDLSRAIIVGADGYFSFPLIGRVRAGGLTVRQLETQLAQMLDKDYIVNPQVTVTVTDYKSKKVFILGEIARPGAYYLSKTDTLLEIISKAGGVTGNAGREILIVRPTSETVLDQPTGLDSQSSEMIRVNLQALLAGNVAENVDVQNNDTIYVPKTSVFSVFGEVGSPGSYPLDKELSILEAISMAGGPTQEADPQRLELLRRDGDEQRKIIVNIRDLLEATDASQKLLIQDGDVIFQPRAKFYFVLGEVNRPGRYTLEDGLTVTKAISVAGGYTDRAARNRVQILRDDNGQQTKHRADANEVVQPQDIIEVPQSFF
jgi:polysaccharide biosynthesis/export protein